MARRPEKHRKRAKKSKRSRPCVGCGYKASKHDKGSFQYHHLVPKKDDRYNIHLEKYRKALTILICKHCHKLVHDTFGPGNNFTGPTTRKHLTRWLQIKSEQKSI